MHLLSLILGTIKTLLIYKQFAEAFLLPYIKILIIVFLTTELMFIEF